MFAGVMTQVGQGLVVAARGLLTPEGTPQLAPGGSLEETGERMCATLAAFAQHAPLMTQGLQELLQQVGIPAKQAASMARTPEPSQLHGVLARGIVAPDLSAGRFWAPTYDASPGCWHALRLQGMLCTRHHASCRACCNRLHAQDPSAACAAKAASNLCTHYDATDHN